MARSKAKRFAQPAQPEVVYLPPGTQLELEISDSSGEEEDKQAPPSKKKGQAKDAAERASKSRKAAPESDPEEESTLEYAKGDLVSIVDPANEADFTIAEVRVFAGKS